MLLAHVDTFPPSAWRFVAGPTGKPEVAPAFARSKLHFNLSHTRGLVACAVGFDYDLGIDAEAVDGGGPKDELGPATTFFAPDEAALLRGLAEDQRRRAFVRIWTLKEAGVVVEPAVFHP